MYIFCVVFIFICFIFIFFYEIWKWKEKKYVREIVYYEEYYINNDLKYYMCKFYILKNNKLKVVVYFE